jgi:HSP20 family protein
MCYPTRGFEKFGRRMGEFANEFEKGFSVEFGGFSPRVDISEDELTVFVQVELPGVKKEDVKLTINDENVLSIKGEKKKDESKDKVYVRSERSYGSFERSFRLSDNINKDSINAKYDNGILNISFQKKEPQKPKEVNINIS